MATVISAHNAKEGLRFVREYVFLHGYGRNHPDARHLTDQFNNDKNIIAALLFGEEGVNRYMDLPEGVKSFVGMCANRKGQPGNELTAWFRIAVSEYLRICNEQRVIGDRALIQPLAQPSKVYSNSEMALIRQHALARNSWWGLGIELTPIEALLA